MDFVVIAGAPGRIVHGYGVARHPFTCAFGDASCNCPIRNNTSSS
ncbi:hypothetical protein [Azospirillum argentinense]